jgi:hypothetical protein
MAPNTSTGQPAATRRDVLKAASAAALAWAAGGLPRLARAQDDTSDDDFNPGGRVRVDYDETLSFNELYDHPPLLGRCEAWRLRIVEDPALYNETVVRYVDYATVLPIYKAIHHPDLRWSYQHNDLWFDVGEGYIHSSWVVPCHEVYHDPEPVIGSGFWGEITVPTSWQHWEPKLRSYRYYDMAYGAVFRVIDRADEPDGRAWYLLKDDVTPGAHWWVQAAHVRRIDPDEFAPISPDVLPDEKRIEVDLDQQTVTCYESDRVVLSTRCATGTVFVDDEGNRHAFYTPRGDHWVRYKRPSRHMMGGEDINDAFDLPGVPWCTFINLDGVAIHGTYWHNDYGRPRSHGCINVTSDAAKWIYRWVNPFTDHDVEEHITARDEREDATQVRVF